MKHFDFKYAKARNFICFGPEGVEIKFDKYGRIVMVSGENLDAHEKESRLASNGVGKSTLADIIVYALFGKPVKRKMTQEDVINNEVKEDLYVEVIWDKYRVVRCRQRGGRKVHTLQLWESERADWSQTNELTQGAKETQSLIEEKLGMSYDAFVNTVVFTDTNSSNFLECKTEEKRGIIDDLFALHKFRSLYSLAKGNKNALKAQIKEMQHVYEQMQTELDGAKRRVIQIAEQTTEWKRIKEQEYLLLVGQVASKQKQLGQSDEGAALAKYLAAQERMKAIAEEIPALEKEEAEFNHLAVAGYSEMESLRPKKEPLLAERQKLRSQIQAAQIKAAESQNLIDSLVKLKGCICPTCYQQVHEENFAAVIANAEKVIAEKKAEAGVLEMQVSALSTGIGDIEATVKNYEAGIAELKKSLAATRTKLASLRTENAALANVKKPEVGLDETIIEQQIADLQSQADAKRKEFEGTSPYAEMARLADEEVVKKRKTCEEYKAAIVEAEDDVPHLEFLIEAFDTEIRKFVIADIIPALNKRIEFWLQFLIDGKIQCTFNEALEETIHRAPYGRKNNPYVYESLSGGQRRRLNLAISQAFAHIMTLSSGVAPSFVFLDEVDQNVDELGIVGIYKMIMELSRDKQVFVTTHSKELKELLQEADRLHLVMKDGFTRMDPGV